MMATRTTAPLTKGCQVAATQQIEAVDDDGEQDGAKHGADDGAATEQGCAADQNCGDSRKQQGLADPGSAALRRAR